MNNRCYYCYNVIDPEEMKTKAGSQGYHEKCCRKFFGKTTPPELNFTEEQIPELAVYVIKSHKTITGVQPKLSLGITRDTVLPDRFTIVGLWGEYILKPQAGTYRNLPEIEDVTMHLAGISGIRTVDHTLIRMKSGQLAYLTKRIDRGKGNKLHMEDMCQLTERLTEHKYKGSYEQIAKAIKKFSVNPGLDVTNFYETVLFCFLTGNNDMHLKNFSLLKTGTDYNLCPAYDLVASALVVEEDDEEVALNLNGRKKEISRNDFQIAMRGAAMNHKVIENIFMKYKKLLPEWAGFIDQSFLPTDLKEKFKALIIEKSKLIELY
ncbi:MAG: HipA domain-containing protein [Bacteroidales bacterium]|nr:HipA domain-containing protein [Bacteroidales bacterium]